MVEIKAECLKWCQFGFKFQIPNTSVVSGVIGYKKGVQKVFYALPNGFVRPNETILVDPEEYTKAVIETVKEMTDGNIWWIEKRYGVISVQYGHKSEVMECNGNYYTKADPQPWLDEYRIEL